MNVPAARQALIAFIKASQRDNMSCVRMIHGKGNRSRHKGPVLKHKVNHWLRQRQEVLAFCSARPMDGGTGAIYVLLRRR
jgi:DNA-nicking Smr family endonuclease